MSRTEAGAGGVLEVNWEEGVTTGACSADPSRACRQGLTQDSTTQRPVVMGAATSKRPKEILAWEFPTLSMGSCGDKAEPWRTSRVGEGKGVESWAQSAQEETEKRGREPESHLTTSCRTRDTGDAGC